MVLTHILNSRQMRTKTHNRLAAGIGLVLVGTLLLTVSAKIQVPFWPVPMTMQTLAVLVLGMLYGRVLGSATVLAYLGEGALGLPVFAGSAGTSLGFGYLMGPTGGYLFGFVLAAWLAGTLAERGWRSVGSAMAAQALGTAVILACGVAWLATIVGFEKAIAVGFTPFILASVLKVALGGAIVAAADRALRKTRV